MTATLLTATLSDFIKNFIDVSEDELNEITEAFKYKKIKKNSYLLRQGEVRRDFVFVASGCIRMYYMSGDMEISAWFSLRNSVAMEIQSFIAGTPSICFLQTIEDSEVWILSKIQLEELYTAQPKMQELMRKIWEAALVMVIPRFSALQNDTAEKRYLDLMNNPELLQQIPQKYLASFIGVTPTSLSRIRKQIK